MLQSPKVQIIKKSFKKSKSSNHIELLSFTRRNASSPKVQIIKKSFKKSKSSNHIELLSFTRRNASKLRAKAWERMLGLEDFFFLYKILSLSPMFYLVV